jgi:uncharacterized Rmd1/YagE family protein
MRCASYAVAESYDLKKIVDYLTTIGNEIKRIELEVLHVRLPIEDVESDVFIFKYGCLTIWGATLHHEKLMIKKLSKYAYKILPKPYDDVCEYTINEDVETDIDEEGDRITIGKHADASMVSLSNGLSQSVKLAQFEDQVLQTIELTKSIPNELMAFGAISMSRRELATKMGELFAVRNLINLHSDLLDTPEFFWRKPKWEPYYVMSVEYLDIKTRTEILNKRLDVLHELYEMLSNELQHVHGSRLELIVICLIAFEVAMTVLHDILGWL